MADKKYTCPMHPEVVSDRPGRCPQCGMALVVAAERSKRVMHQTDERGLGPLTWQNYIPLVVILLIIFVVALVDGFIDRLPLAGFIINFMTGFFLVFAGFKLMDLKGFAEGYSTYDLLAKRWFGYGYIYPFIELAFGLLMFAGYHPDWLLWSEFAVMAFSGLGVSLKLARRESFRCVCLGTFLKVPLTYVTLVEDFGMAALALVVIWLT